jgi:hypothetical protein
MNKNKRRRSSSRDHHGGSDKRSTSFEVVGKHGDDYKGLFNSFISSDAVFDKLQVIQIIELIKEFAIEKRIDTTSFELDMNIKSIAKLLFLVSQVESSRVTKHEDTTWSLSRVELVMSKHNVITSKKHITDLKKKGEDLAKLKAKSKVLTLLLMTLAQFFKHLGCRSQHRLIQLERHNLRETAFVNFLFPIRWRS